ncbi:MAG TPA: putative baseplate assembly protein [Thermodesulfobacteriota bacterium]|nr:putative baseplate assembly protein [Thermodesulfobacteriota bacterium]
MGLPVPNLDDKTFDEIVQEARSLIARFAPGWTDHNVHDPGITFIELFAWLAEMQIYQLNRVTDENYEKFLKLAGLSPIPAQPARVEITFENITAEKVMHAGTQVITEIMGEKIVFETEEEFTLIPVSLKSVITTRGSQSVDNTEANEKDGIDFAPFGEGAPQGAALELGFDKPLPEKDIHITFVIFDEDLPSPGSHGVEQPQVAPSANVVWEYLSGGIWNAVSIKKDNTLALTRSGRIVFEGPASMDKKDGLYWIRCRLEGGGYEIVPRIYRILLNTVSAVQVETVSYEDLGTGLGIPEYKVKLKKPPVIKGSQQIQVQKEGSEWEDWKEVDDFEFSGPADLHYMFGPEKGEITFGNGLNGRIADVSHRIRATYKTTLGQSGNISQGQIWWINKAGFEGIIGENQKEAEGGKAAESIEQAKGRAKKDFRTRYRAITSGDYELLAISTPGMRVARAKAIPGYNPDYPCITVPGAVTVVVVPYVREGTVTPVPGDGFIQTVFRHLDAHRLVTTDLYVIGPEYVKISVKCRVHMMKRSSPIEIGKRVKEALERFLDPLEGGPDGKGWPFGRSVFPSEIYQIIDGVEGVDYATGVSISAEGQYMIQGGIIKISPIALVFSGEHELEAV